MEFSVFKGLIPYLKDHKTMLLLGLIIGASCLTQALFELGFFASIGIGLIAIFAPLVAFNAIKDRQSERKKAARLETLRKRMQAPNRWNT